LSHKTAKKTKTAKNGTIARGKSIAVQLAIPAAEAFILTLLQS